MSVPNPDPNPTPNPAPTPDPKDKIISDLAARLEALEKKGNPAPTPDPKDADDLAAKAKLQRETEDAKKKDSKAMENALRFTIGSKDWFKTNASLLPKSIEGILAQSEKETYDSVIEKDSAIKVGIISEFFSQQANLDLLVPGLKNQLEEFLKLSKTVKQDKAQQIYDSIFEPTFDMLKRIKRAELQNKGMGNPSDAESAYKEKLIKGTRKHYLGEK